MKLIETPPLHAGALYKKVLRDGSILECICISTETPPESAAARPVQGVLRNHKQGDLSVSEGSEALAHFALVGIPVRMESVFKAGKHYHGTTPAEDKAAAVKKKAEAKKKADAEAKKKADAAAKAVDKKSA